MRVIIAILLMFTIHIGFAGTPVTDMKITDIELNNHETEKVILTPNPALDYTTIKIVDRNSQVTQISVYSLLGNQIFVKNYSGRENSISLNVQSFKKGKYLVKVIFKDGSSEVKALIKQ